MTQITEEQDIDYCSDCDAVMRFNKCSNGCHDRKFWDKKVKEGI